jgi:hypothetical protein
MYQGFGGGLQGFSFPSEPTAAGAILPLYFQDTTVGIMARDRLRTAPNLVMEEGGKSIVVPLGRHHDQRRSNLQHGPDP